MNKFLFASPVFNKGLNLSVRRGVKWSLETEAMVADLDGKEYGEVKLSTKVMCFYDLCDEDLQYEHEPSCRTYDGLLESMIACYPGFDEREMVTLVCFEM